MNYRHIYHAGNFADVFKHVVLSRIMAYLKRKEAAFRVIDTHAGIGLYDLGSEEAQKTGEWRGGIGRLMDAAPAGAPGMLLQDFLGAVRACNPSGSVERYPGSPLLARHFLRRQDRLTAIELHPEDALSLKKLFAGDYQVRVIELDGWLALGAHLPPKEKRGLVLVDPPFEDEGEFERMVDGLKKAYRRWPGGIYAFWYPVKDRATVERFRRELAETGIPKILDASMTIRAPSAEPRLDGCGMAIVNPPFVLGEELTAILPLLTRTLGEDKGAAWSVEQLAGDAA
jgi:23S rRNA (adenine2030-N6)-methyltransferase